jgi:hypothetical protein
MVSVAMLSVVMLSVVMLNVVAPVSVSGKHLQPSLMSESKVGSFRSL